VLHACVGGSQELGAREAGESRVLHGAWMSLEEYVQGGGERVLRDPYGTRHDD